MVLVVVVAVVVVGVVVVVGGTALTVDGSPTLGTAVVVGGGVWGAGFGTSLAAVGADIRLPSDGFRGAHTLPVVTLVDVVGAHLVADGGDVIAVVGGAVLVGVFGAGGDLSG